MPELPEVEHARSLAEARVVGRVLTTVRVERDDIVFEGVSPAKVRRAVQGRVVQAVRRWGKHLWFEFSEPPHLLFHLGMTGRFRVPGTDPLRLEADGAKDFDDVWPPRFTKLELTLDDGGALAFTNARRLGRIRLRDDPRSEPPLKGLGFDPLLDLPSVEEFRRRVQTRRTTLKGLLLNQSFAAGVGNWIADEVLYQARLDPRRVAADLDDSEAKRLRQVLERVIAKSVAVDADKRRFPKTWLFHHRWGRTEGARTARGEPIEFITVAGRTTAWVPSVQSSSRP